MIFDKGYVVDSANKDDYSRSSLSHSYSTLTVDQFANLTEKKHETFEGKKICSSNMGFVS